MNIGIVVIAIISIILFISVYQPIETFETTLTQSEKIKLFQCMIAIHELFETNKLWYVISFGTLLGAVRHKGIIPWDDDIDLIVDLKDIEKIRQVFKILNSMGYKTEETFKLMRVYADEKHFIDFFFIDNVDGKIMRCYTTSNTCNYPKMDEDWWHKFFNFSPKQIIPRKLYQFGSLYLWGPENAFPILRFWYGDDFLTVCKTHYLKDHGDGGYVTPQKEMCIDYGAPQF